MKIFRKDPSLKKQLLKTTSWFILMLTFILFYCMLAGNGVIFSIVFLGLLILSYFLHERLWSAVKPGYLSKFELAKKIKKDIQPNLFKQTAKITRPQPGELNNHQSFTLWFTGLSSSGKSTLAAELEARLFAGGYRTYILDGDNTRLGVNSDLSFSREDRAENIRRVAEICKLLNEAGLIVIASFISPFEDDRLLAANIIEKKSFIEVYIDSSLEVCKNRDTKGLYKLAMLGKIKDFTGIDSPYEPPLTPDIHLTTDSSSPDECVNLVIDHLVYNKRIQSIGVLQ
ncbi:MAG: adenylyl-sulfate kinase [Mucilaginibacter sp.]|nr:adenylyl-sulfate kinase [Mucilaginibacter sp.]